MNADAASGEALAVAILDDYQGVALSLADWQRLPPGTRIEVFRTPASDADALVQRLQPFDVVVAMRERTAFPAEVVARLPRLKLLATTGLRNAAIDLAACHRQGVVVTGARGARTGLAGTAETAWALVLALAKHLPRADAALRAGQWQPELADTLAGRTLGLAGLGNIGQKMARIGRAFDMDVIAWSPNLTPERAQAGSARAVSCDELFASSDVLSLHLVLGPTTAGLVDDARLRQMKPTAVLVNTARAGLIDEAAFLSALRDRRLAGAGLDVFWQEPLPPTHPLCGLRNVVLSPHLGYATPDNLSAFYRGVVDAIDAWVHGRPPLLLAG
jgi:phosphoglycerate dehydrogenase-like enzyme